MLSYALARHWGREALWPRFATAFNWCQWAIPAVAFLLLLAVSLLIALGVPNEAGGPSVVAGLAGYGLWLHWFLARHGLRSVGAARGGAGGRSSMPRRSCWCVGPLLIAVALRPAGGGRMGGLQCAERRRLRAAGRPAAGARPAGGAAHVDNDLRVAARSFWAAGVALPAFLCLRLLDWAADGLPAHPAMPGRWICCST